MTGLFTMFKWILLVSIINCMPCLRLTYLDVPHSVQVGKEVKLNCIYELDGDVLYSVKWYRDEVEFYRFVPSDKPPGQFFPLPGIKVDVDQSSNGTVFLHDVSTFTAGTFRCEVSADAPSFKTVAAFKIMYVNDVSKN